MIDLVLILTATLLYVVMAKVQPISKQTALVMLSTSLAGLIFWLFSWVVNIALPYMPYGSIVGIGVALAILFAESKVIKYSKHELKSKFWKITAIVLPILILAVAPQVFAIDVSWTIQYNGTNIDGTLYFFDGTKVVEVSFTNGSVTTSVPELPINITILYENTYYLVEVKDSSGVIDLYKIPFFTVNVTSNIPVKVVLENVKLGIETNFIVKANTTTYLTAPIYVFHNYNMYKLVNITVSGNATVSDNKVKATGDSTVELQYEVYSILGIPVIYIIAGVVLLILASAVLVATRKSTMSKYAQKGEIKYWEIK